MQRCRQQEPQVVAELELMMAEMARITVLPTELWHTALTEVQVSFSNISQSLCHNGMSNDGVFNI